MSSAAPTMSVYTHTQTKTHRRRAVLFCYSAAWQKMVKQYWWANTDDVTVTRRLVWNGKTGPVRRCNCGWVYTATCWKKHYSLVQYKHVHLFSHSLPTIFFCEFILSNIDLIETRKPQILNFTKAVVFWTSHVFQIKKKTSTGSVWFCFIFIQL